MNGPPPGYAGRTEAPIPAVNPVSEKQPHSQVPRAWVKDAIRVLQDAGYTVSGAQAWHLLKDWRAWRRADARRFIAAEFLAYAAKRGDLIQPRTKRNYRVGEAGWRTSS